MTEFRPKKIRNNLHLNKLRRVVFIAVISILSMMLILFVFYNYLIFSKKYDDDETGFFSYQDKETNDNSIFSKLGTDYFTTEKFSKNEKYICSGTCHCDEDDDQRKTTSTAIKPLGRGLMFIVAALTSYKAIELAKKHFEEECEEVMEEICSSKSSIRSQVEVCSKGEVEDEDYDVRLLELEKMGVRIIKKEKIDKKGKKKYQFLCKGNCLPGSFQEDIYKEKQVDPADYDWRGFFKQTASTFRSKPAKKMLALSEIQRISNHACHRMEHEEVKTIYASPEETVDDISIVLERLFIEEDLHPWCHYKSKYMTEKLNEEEELELQELMDSVDTDNSLWQTLHTGICVGKRNGGNTNVGCYDMYDM